MNASYFSDRKLYWLTAFAVGMGFLEAIVVVYLRELYYPEGFEFPLKVLSGRIYMIELLRELSTLVMLLAVGFLAGRSLFTGFTYFLFTFGAWDIFYYAGLKCLLNWPADLLTWDVLFLIPVTWAGPVLAPVLCASLMILAGLMVHFFYHKGFTQSFRRPEWTLMITGALFVLVSFMWDYTRLLLAYRLISRETRKEEIISAVSSFIPQDFLWELFIPGIILIMVSLAFYAYRFCSWKKLHRQQGG